MLERCRFTPGLFTDDVQHLLGSVLCAEWLPSKILALCLSFGHGSMEAARRVLLKTKEWWLLSHLTWNNGDDPRKPVCKCAAAPASATTGTTIRTAITTGLPFCLGAQLHCLSRF